MSDPYAALVAIAEHEQTLIDDGRIEELEALAAHRHAIVATLPSEAPASARPALERARALQMATTAKLQATLGEMRHQINAIDRGRTVARAYVLGPPAAPAHRLDAAA